MKALLLTNLLIAIISMMAFPLSAGTIEGNWILDVDRTRDFNVNKVNLSQVEKNFLSCASHKFIFAFPNWTILHDKQSCMIDGMNVTLRSYTIDLSFKVIGETDNITLIESKDEFGGHGIDACHFEGNDAFWHYHYSEDSDMHLRIYFKRVK